VTALAEVVDLAVVRGAHARAIPVEEYVAPFTLAEIDAEVAAIRAELARPLQRLARLRAAGAHLTAGFASWHEAVEVWLGDLQSLRLTGSAEAVAEREALVWSMREQGAATRAIRERLGVSSYAVNEALRKLDPSPERITGADGASRSSRTGRAAPVAPLGAPEGQVWQQAAEWVRRAAAGLLAGREAGGLTLGELARVAGWSEGKASGALNRAMRHGAVVRAEGKRGTVRAHYPAEVPA
jgi:lambda repressor-like predicted transcriptional regulator